MFEFAFLNINPALNMKMTFFVSHKNLETRAVIESTRKYASGYVEDEVDSRYILFHRYVHPPVFIFINSCDSITYLDSYMFILFKYTYTILIVVCPSLCKLHRHS